MRFSWLQQAAGYLVLFFVAFSASSCTLPEDAAFSAEPQQRHADRRRYGGDGNGERRAAHDCSDKHPHAHGDYHHNTYAQRDGFPHRNCHFNSRGEKTGCWPRQCGPTKTAACRVGGNYARANFLGNSAGYPFSSCIGNISI